MSTGEQEMLAAIKKVIFLQKKCEMWPGWASRTDMKMFIHDLAAKYEPEMRWTAEGKEADDGTNT